ncbi:MAG: winged helix-turn-helix domain-containing protein [Candidatus Hodarchaeales archaeon]|jgi:DNA-binding transcriptional ArsR family regulator
MDSNLILKKRHLISGVDTIIWFNYVHSPDYKPILDALEFGPLTIDEIRKKINLKKSQSTLYRYLQDLEDVNLVIRAGRTQEKIVKRQKTGLFTPHKILYDRTSELFLVSRPEAKAWAVEKSDLLVYALGTMIKRHFDEISPRVETLRILLIEFETELEMSIQDVFAAIINDSKTSTQAKEILSMLKSTDPNNFVTFINLFSRLFWIMNQSDIDSLYDKLKETFINNLVNSNEQKGIDGILNSEDARKGTSDYVEYTPILYQPIKREIWKKIKNYNHRAILYLLRKPMTIQEIAENHHDAVLQNIEVGRRIKDGKALTEILYARKALYVSEEQLIQDCDSDEWNHIVDMIGLILQYHFRKKGFNREKLLPFVTELDHQKEIIKDPIYNEKIEYPPSEILYGIDILYLHVLFDTLAYFEWYITNNRTQFKNQLTSCFFD